MAAVSLSPLPQHPIPMSSKRVPLANNPNAANSPFRGTAAAKRSRPANAEQGDLANDQSPAKKKQLLEFNNNGTRRSHNIPVHDRESKLFNTRTDNTSNNAFAKRLAAVKEAKPLPQKTAVEKDDKRHKSDLEDIKQWRKHYHKLFPSLVFYFESLPQDVCIRSSRQIAALGASEEKFFSRAVTHIVTSRQVPNSIKETDSNADQNPSSRAESSSQHGQSRTINPSLLEKVVDGQHRPLQQRLKHMPEMSQLKKPNVPGQDAEPRRAQTSHTDILHKAREMKIKIWALEKFERIMATMFNEELNGSEDVHVRKELAATKPSRAADLSQLLREEKKVTAERTWSDVVPFRGYYVYVHDMDERTRPSIVREYQKVAAEDGEWPQLRSVPMPRCPFVEEYSVRRDPKEKAKQDKKAGPGNVDEKEQQPPRTRSVSAAVQAAKETEPGESRSVKQPLRENEDKINAAPKPAMAAPPSKNFEPPKLKPSLSINLDSLPPHLTNPRFTFTGVTRNPGREPAASGVNPSNVTSAIRSQMISSTAANPGARAGTSKELHQLQRKALERRSGLSNNSMPSSYMNDVRAAINNDQTAAPKHNLRRKPGTLTKIHEDETQSDDDDDPLANGKETRAPKKKTAPKREPKPGYCENCKDKYEDFNEHVESRKHKKFALTAENWTELDTLLSKLERPLNRSKASNNKA